LVHEVKNGVTAIPCTPLQAGMYATTMKSRTAYVSQLYWRVADKDSLPAVLEGWRAVVEKHRMLASRIVATSEGLYQVLDGPDGGQLDRIKGSVKDFLCHDAEKGFGDDSLWLSRMTVVEDGQELFLVLTMHHCVYDGWSFGFLAKDWSDAILGRELLPGGQFVDFVRYHQHQDRSETREYWKQYLAGVEPSNAFTQGITSIHRRPEVCVDIFTFGVSSDEVNKTAIKIKTTAANLFRVGWGVTLQIFSGKDDVVFGEVVSGRDVPIDGIER
jgi:hypothetical protein